MRFQRPAVLIVTVALLAACGPVHPGAAATVDGQDISFKTLDRTARVYCEIQARSTQQGVQPADPADTRRQAALFLVVARVADRVVDARGLEVEPVQPTTADQTAELQRVFGPRADAVERVIREDGRYVQALAAIGADGLNTTQTEANTSQLAEAGRNLVLGELDRYDVEFAPRLGLDDAGDPTGGVGSLSVQAAAADAPATSELPPALQCSA